MDINYTCALCMSVCLCRNANGSSSRLFVSSFNKILFTCLVLGKQCVFDVFMRETTNQELTLAFPLGHSVYT
jgi:hypothetical protein